MYFSSIILSDIVEYAQLQGLDVNRLPDFFNQRNTKKYISYDTTIEALNYVGQELNDDYLGLHIGEQIGLKVTAQVNAIMHHSQSLEESFDNAVEYSKLISDALECRIEKSEEYYAVVYEENPNWKVHQTHAKKQILDLTLLSCLKSLIAYTQRDYYPVKVNFHNTKPQNMNLYYRLFNCHLNFNQPVTEIVFERQIFNRHSKKVRLGLLEEFKANVSDEIAGLAVEDERIYALKKCMLKHKPQRISVEEASEQLNVSKRTLQRELKTLGTSFKKVEYELQVKLAKTYLKEGVKSIDEISYLLGFSESSAFIRFFKSHTGYTPMKYIAV